MANKKATTNIKNANHNHYFCKNIYSFIVKREITLSFHDIC